MNRIERFVDYIASLKTPNDYSLNIYAGNSKEAEIKRIFLRYYLDEMKKRNPTRIFIGEAPGNKGCFNTGVPFTDEFTISTNPFFADIKKNLSADKKQNERTATIVWECLSTISTDEYPLMWNIFPFHPSYVDSTHMLAKERKNRKPNIRECELGTEILKELIDCFDSVHHFYAVGRVPWYKLKKIHPDITYIRHPSYGGVNIFRDNFNNIFSSKK